MVDTLTNYTPTPFPQIEGAYPQYFTNELRKISSAINSAEDEITNIDDTFAPLASPALTGVPTAPTAAVNTKTTQLATTAFVLANGPQEGADVASASGNVTGTSLYPTFIQAGYKATYTPVRTGRLLVIMQQALQVATNGLLYIGSYGTGTPPAAGAAATGTEFTALGIVWSPVAQATLIGMPSVLTVGTTYWFDLQYAANTASTPVTVDNGRVLIIEL